MNRVVEVLLVATRLGLTSFGGPIAHIGYFRDEYVVRRKWLTEERFGELVALCQFLPGPASSQLGIAIGMGRGGYPGAFAAWLGFTLPSAAALVLLAYGVHEAGEESARWLRGLKVVAVAVVALALWGMARTLAPDRARITIAGLAAVALLLTSGIVAQLAVIAGGAALGLAFLRDRDAAGDAGAGNAARWPWTAIVALVVFGTLLALLPTVVRVIDSVPLAVADSFFRSGSLVFGGGHVVLPLLEAEVVPRGWVTKDEFIAGYGAAQAIPGPLFTFAAYLGAIINPVSQPWLGGLLALAAIFAPSFVLVAAVLPFWERLRRLIWARRALMGVNAAVVGLLLAALYDPVWTSSILVPEDFAIAAGAFVLLAFWKVPPWLVVALAAGTGAMFTALN